MSNEWIGTRLKGLRVTKGSLAKSLGIDPARVSEIIGGRRNVQVSEVPVMAEILQMTTEELVARLAPHRTSAAAETPRPDAAAGRPPLAPSSGTLASLPQTGQMPRNLPIYGSARGGTTALSR